MNNPNKPTRAKEHKKANRQLLPRKSLAAEHGADQQHRYLPLDVSDIPRATLTSVACNNCRLRKSKKCIYRAEVTHEKIVELRKGSKDLFQALELLRTAPEESVATILHDLRSGGSVSDFLLSIDSITTETSSLLNPLNTSLAGTSASSALELDLNMRYSNAFPRLETLTISNVDLGLLADEKRKQKLLTPSEATSISPYSPIDFSGRQPATPTTSESFSTPSDTTGCSSQQPHIDHRLEGLQIWQWTSVPIPDTLAEQTISFYLTNEHPLLAFFDADLFIRDLVSGGGRFCTPLLVSSLLAWSCASYSQFEPRAQPLSFAFLNEAKRRWRDLQDYNSIATLGSAMFLTVTCNQHGQDRVGLFYLDASAEIGRRLGLFGDNDVKMTGLDDDEELKSAASYAAWGSFGWHSLHSINFRTQHRILRPPSLPIPGDAYGPPLIDHMGKTFTWICKFWSITHEIFGEGFNSYSRLPMSHAHQMYQLLLDWAAVLPDEVKRSDTCPHHVLVLHIWYHTAIIDVWRPFIERHQDEDAAESLTANDAHKASVLQLKRLIYTYRTRFESTHMTMLITPGLIILINEVFRNPEAPDAQFWFMLAARGSLSIASWCKGLRGITEGLMTIGWQNGTFKRHGWVDNSMIEDIRAATRALVQDGAYSSLYPISLNSMSEDMEDIGMEALAKDFHRLTAQNEPHGQEVKMTNEQHVWKGDPRDLTLTLSEAIEEEEYR
ncbi:conidial development fluffy [Fusarium longipes]|uniref:Conidial development fluffy n=1 Tax=Fusarium longipes TaxID=694270 RepID=A0A395RG41_9HYPO|nr:conidial development fluffy [Fusarium longipes]